MSLLSTAELHRQAMSSYSISLAFSLEVSSWEGWPTGVFKHAFIPTCISLSNQSYLYDFERKYLMKKIRWGRKPALLISILASSGGELVGAFMPEFWSYAASRLGRRHSVYFFHDKNSQSTPTRFVTGAGQQGIFNTAFSLSFEIIGPGLRFVLSRNSSTMKIECLQISENQILWVLKFSSSGWRVPLMPWISLQTVMGLAPSVAFAIGLIVVYIIFI